MPFCYLESHKIYAFSCFIIPNLYIASGMVEPKLSQEVVGYKNFYARITLAGIPCCTCFQD